MMDSAIFRPMGVDIFCLGRKYLIFNFVAKNLKVKYRRSVFGVLWTLIVPLATAAIYYFVFQILMKVKSENYLIMIISGILPWTFFSQSINEGVICVVESAAGLVTKVPIPVHSIPLITVITHLVTLMLSFPVIVLAAFVSGVGIHPSIIMFFVYSVLLFLMAYSFSNILAIAYGYLRDLKHAVGIIVSLWFFGTPIVYSAESIPEQYQWILYANPVGMLFSGMQAALVRGEFPSFQNFMVPVAWAGVLMIFNILVTKFYARKMVELL